MESSKYKIKQVAKAKCPYCGLEARKNKPGDVLLLNAANDEYLILCECRERYICIWIDEAEYENAKPKS